MPAVNSGKGSAAAVAPDASGTTATKTPEVKNDASEAAKKAADEKKAAEAKKLAEAKNRQRQKAG